MKLSLLAAVCVFGFVGAAAAQVPDQAGEPNRLTVPRVAVGAEVSGVAGKRDYIGFFNYTDYEHNALRSLRFRLFGELRLASRLSVLAELRQEDRDQLELAALYVRWRPSATNGFDIQAGRIPPVFGAFSRRAYGRDNAVIGAPLAYQYLTSLRPDALPAKIDDVLRMRARGWQPSYPIGSQTLAPGVPLLSGLRWDTGAEVRWRGHGLELASAVTLGAPAVPVVRETNGGRQWSGRAAFVRDPRLSVGVSAARGAWIERGVLDLVPVSVRTKSSQTVAGIDAESGWAHVLVRAEWLWTAFDVPLSTGETSARLTATSGFGEVRYRFHPRWQIGLRAERLGFSTVRSGAGVLTKWDAPVDRVEAAIGFRVSRRFDLRAAWQQNWRDAGRARNQGFPALQWIARF